MRVDLKAPAAVAEAVVGAPVASEPGVGLPRGHHEITGSRDVRSLAPAVATRGVAVDLAVRSPTAVEDGRALPGRLPAAIAAIRIDLLVTFAVVSQELHFGRAAQALYVSESGLSRRVTLLERCLGVALLDRTTRRVVLTDAGRRVLPHVLAILQDIEAVADVLTEVIGDRCSAFGDAPSQRGA